MTVFLATYTSIFNLCYNRNVHTYATNKELKKTAFTVKSQNIIEAIGIQVTFILEKKHRKEHSLIKI